MKSLSPFNSLCLECTTNVPSITLINERERIISLKCKCGYEKELPISSYLNIHNKSSIPCSESLYKCVKHNQVHTSYCQECDILFCKKCPHNSEHVIEDLNYSFDDKLFEKRVSDLKLYLLKVKTKGEALINKFKKELNNSYKQCLDMNNEICSLLSILKKNCIENNAQVKKNFYTILGDNIMNYPKQFECKEESFEGIIDYFKRFKIQKGNKK